MGSGTAETQLFSLAINSLKNYLTVLPHGHARGNPDFSSSQTLETTDLALEGMSDSRNDDCKELALNDALTTFGKKTQILYRSFSSFEFPAGNLSRRFRTAVVSDLNKVNAQTTTDATVTNYLVDTDRLASAQSNRSEVLVSTETTDLDEGTYTFTLTVGDDSYSLGITVDKSGLHPDTNKDVLEKLAREVGAADANIEASVTETDRKIYSTLSDNMYEKVAYLTVRSKSSGDSIHFSLSDDTGSIIDTLDINHIAQGGQRCKYYLDSIPSTAAANTVSADANHLTMSLLDVTGDPVTITVKDGLEPVQEKLTDLISEYNDYVSWLDQNSNYITPAVKTGIVEEIDSISGDLSSIGLRFGANGRVNITDDFTTALQSDIAIVREIVSGEHGFFPKVVAKLADILENGIDEYGLDQSQPAIYNQDGIGDTFFMISRKTSELSLYA